MAWPSAAAATSAARLAGPSWPPHLAMAVVTVGAALFGWAGVLLIDPSNEGLSDCWGVDGIFLVAAALGWAQGPGRRWRGLLCYGVGAAAGFLVGGSVAGAGLDENVTIYPGCVLGDGVAIGDDSVLHANVARRPVRRRWIPARRKAGC